MFWDILFAQKRPIVGLSPMDGVTDAAMRYMSAKYGKRKENSKSEIRNPCPQMLRIKRCRRAKQILSSKNLKLNDENLKLEHGVDVMFSEFVSVDALHYATGERRERLLKTFIYDEIERPIVAQVFGKTPELFAEAAILIEKLGFDGIDINMGCPAHKVEENGAGAGLIRTPKLAQEIIGVVKSATSLPVSVKTRIGVDRDVAEEWMEQLMEVKPAMISLHGRTLKQLYQGLADWEAIARAAKVVHKRGGYILGNGDVKEMLDARRKTLEYGVDGVLIGRAAEGNPTIFNSQITNSQILQLEPSKEQRLAWMVEHAKKFEELFDNFMPMRKHLAWYCKGFPGASELRTKLVQANNAAEVEKIVGKAI